MKETLQNYIDGTITILEEAKSKLESVDLNSIIIDSKYFDERFMHNANISEVFEEFKELKTIINPVLYWFEFTSTENNEAIRKKYICYREPMKKNFSDEHYRNTSSYKKNFAADSKTLYVGKVETGFWGRLVTHLGYNQSIKTAGMQLNHWCELSLLGELRLNYFVFEPNMKHLIIVLEKRLAIDLKPLIGKY